MTKRASLVALVIIVAIVMYEAWSQHHSTGDVGGTDGTAVTEVSTARDELHSLEVKGKAPKKDTPGGMYQYSRDRFGQRWSDDVTVDGGHNGCDTRNDILRAQLDDITIKPGTHECLVLSGRLVDPYSEESVDYVRGHSDVEIDHVVPLANAWQTGAFAWDDEKRRNFSNDPANLLAVRGDLNRHKRDGDAATWLPPCGQCEYVIKQVNVKHTYGLWVTEAEKDTLERVLDGCGGAEDTASPFTDSRGSTGGRR